MKRRGATVDGTKLNVAWMSGYVGLIGRTYVRFVKGERGIWIARRPIFPSLGKEIARGKTLAEAVRNTKAALA